MSEDALQLSLFSPKNLALGEAREALESLCFQRALGLYRGVLARWPDTEDASEGLELAGDWAAFFGELKSLKPAEAAVRLFEELQERDRSARSPGCFEGPCWNTVFISSKNRET